MKLYQGKYRVSNPSKYKGDLDNIIYRSMWEAKCFAWCDKNPKIKSWSSEETVVPYYYDIDKKYHKYFIDLKINFKDGSTNIINKYRAYIEWPGIYFNEGMTYVKNMNKWKAANEMAKDRGWEFQIWTEDTLHEMGILPKWKKMKKLKPLKRI